MYQVIALVHLLAAITWIGGTLFLALVLVPLTRQLQEPPGAAARWLSAAARRFRLVAWTALAVLVGTGIWLLFERNVPLLDILRGSGWFIQTLRIKVGLVALVLVLSALHDFVLGPRVARRLEAVRGPIAGSARAAGQRRLLSWLARVNLLLTLGIVALAVVLLRGTPF